MEKEMLLCGNCRGWVKGKITYPAGRVGRCPVDGKNTAKIARCRFPEQMAPDKITKKVMGGWGMKRLDIKDDDISRLRENGMKPAEIAKELGMTATTIKNRLLKIDVEMKRRQKPDKPTGEMGIDVAEEAIQHAAAVVGKTAEPYHPDEPSPGEYPDIDNIEDIKSGAIEEGLYISWPKAATGPWNTHTCLDMPDGAMVCRDDAGGVHAMSYGIITARDINVCPWCAAKLREADDAGRGLI